MSPRATREERETQILDGASRVFGRRGFAAASMDEISQEAGLTKPMLYHYFGSKDGLFLACAVRLWQGMGAAILAGATSDAPAETRLWRAVVGYYRFVGDHREEWRVMYPELGPGGADAGEQLAQIRRGALAMMNELFTASAVEQGLAPELLARAEPMAYGFTGAATAIAAWWLDHPELPPEVPAENMMNLAWRGFERLMREELWSPPSG